MKKILIACISLCLVLGSTTALSAADFNCGRIMNNWPPALPKATGSTCKLHVQAANAQEAFELCTVRAANGKNCCVDNAVWKNIKGVAVIQGNNVTHIQCPGR
jgi:hypothetical protein